MIKPIIGRRAFLRDAHCRPKEIGACRIIAASRRGAGYVIVEWDIDGTYHTMHDVSVVEITALDIR